MKVSNLISKLVSRFLVNNGFLIREISKKTRVSYEVSKDSENLTNVTGFKNHQGLPLTFEELAHVKIGGQRKYLFIDEELKGGISNLPSAKRTKIDNQRANIEFPSRENNNFKINKINENECVKQADSIKKDFYVDLRTENS